MILEIKNIMHVDHPMESPTQRKKKCATMTITNIGKPKSKLTNTLGLDFTASDGFSHAILGFNISKTGVRRL